MIKSLDSLPAFVKFLVERIKVIILLLICILYVVLFRIMNFTTTSKAPAEIDEEKYEILKLVDIMEYIPEPEPEPLPPPPQVEEVIQVEDQAEASEIIQEVEEVVQEIHEEKPVNQNEEQTSHNVGSSSAEEIEYLPQHKITVVPVIPTKEILSKIVYPPMAHRQGIQAVVYLELYIDADGTIRKIEVLKDPGHGFAEAAIAAMEGIKCEPAQANGKAVPVRFRYPVKFTLK